MEGLHKVQFLTSMVKHGPLDFIHLYTVDVDKSNDNSPINNINCHETEYFKVKFLLGASGELLLETEVEPIDESALCYECDN
jgi:hypothetical protein